MLDQPFWFFTNFGELERGLSATMVTLSMLGMGATLTVRDFATTLFAWKGLAVGLAAQLLLVPAWAGLVMFVLGLFPEGFGGLSVAGAVGIATGLALVAAMPGGAASNLLTFLGNGNVALSVSLTAITTFACLLATPIVLASLVMVRVPGDFEIDKSQIMLDIGLFLLAPLLAGMVFRAYTTLPQQVLFIKLMVRASLCLLALIIIGSLGAGRLQFAAYGWLGPAIIIVFCLGAVILARLFATVCGTSERDAFAIVIEVAVKNGLLALLIITSMFPSHMLAAQDGPHAQMIAAARDGCIFVVLFFSGVGLVIGMLSALRWRKILAPAR
ncbi:MAG: bile acid:sodium symporter family protein [Methyloceanibacter sp.]|uniref:bile acid:sodium symporter family protein n=1 Tax=Methyloceanibacter sp. TaxID=1965321 RepID=UPI003EE09661